MLCLNRTSYRKLSKKVYIPIPYYSPSRMRKVAKGVEKPVFQECLTILNVLTHVNKMTMLVEANVAVFDVVETIKIDQRLN